jgi:hypothetical protein
MIGSGTDNPLVQAVTLEMFEVVNETLPDSTVVQVQRSVDYVLGNYEIQPVSGAVRDVGNQMMSQPVATNLMIGKDSPLVAQQLFVRLADGRRLRVERVGHFGSHLEAWLTDI